MSEEGIVVENGPGASDAGNADAAPAPINFGGGDAGGSNEVNWRDSIPEEYRESSWATKYESAEEFYKGIDNMASLVGKKSDGIKVPGEGATDEDWGNFYNSLGRPEDANGYKLELDQKHQEWFQDGDVDAITNMFHKAGLNDQMAQTLLNEYMDWQSGKMDAFSESMLEDRAASESALKKEWNDKYDEKVATARRGAEAAGVLEALDSAGLGNNAAVIKLAELAGRAVSEDFQRDGGQFSQAMNKEKAEAELNQITKNPNFRNDPKLSQRVSELMDIIKPGTQMSDGVYSVNISSF